MSTKREFVVFIEFNPNEQETFIYYLQWTGNEEKLTLLHQILDKADFSEWTGGKPAFSIDINYKLSEEVVDAHTRVLSINHYYKMFTKCTGEFKWKLENLIMTLELEDEYQMGGDMFDQFCCCRIKEMFSDYRNLYKELLDNKITREEYERLSIN